MRARTRAAAETAAEVACEAAEGEEHAAGSDSPPSVPSVPIRTAHRFGPAPCARRRSPLYPSPHLPPPHHAAASGRENAAAHASEVAELPAEKRPAGAEKRPTDKSKSITNAEEEENNDPELMCSQLMAEV